MTNYLIIELLTAIALSFLIALAIATFVADIGFPLPPAASRIGCIDGLRGYLALSVLCQHFILWIYATRIVHGWKISPINFFGQMGFCGVALFFMTTGLVFYPRILSGFARVRWRSVYVSRIFRIMPMVIFSVALVIIIISVRTGNGIDKLSPIGVVHWIFLSDEVPLLGYVNSVHVNSGVLWSLWFEWLFYLTLLPICAVLMDVIRGRLPSWSLPSALLIVSIAIKALHILRPLQPYIPENFLAFFTFIPLFAIGMLAYECKQQEAIARVLQGRIMSVIAITSLGLVMIFISTSYYYALPMLALFFISVACGNDLGGFLKFRGSLVLGECSYSIYIIHGLILSIMFTDSTKLTNIFSVNQLPIIMPFAVIFVIIFTFFTYLFIERPTINLGKRFR